VAQQTLSGFVLKPCRLTPPIFIVGRRDGAAGLKILQSDARIDLLITDLGLPGGLNGRQVAEAARIIHPT
jgi:CheY-like chemotaxis protein